MRLPQISTKAVKLTFIANALALSMAHASIVSAEPVCRAVTTEQIGSLFDDWNKALQTGDARQVVSLYAENSPLLATLAAAPRVTQEEKLEYFEKFLLLKPVGKIESAWIDIECNAAVNTGLYTFTLADGRTLKARYTFTYEFKDDRWVITSHHSSLAPP